MCDLNTAKLTKLENKSETMDIIIPEFHDINDQQHIIHNDTKAGYHDVFDIEKQGYTELLNNANDSHIVLMVKEHLFMVQVVFIYHSWQ